VAKKTTLSKANQRMVVVFHADHPEVGLQDFIAGLWHAKKLIISSSLSSAIRPEQAVTKLGEEYDLVFFDARDSFNPDALGVVSGVLCGGGSLIIMLPEVKFWHIQNSLFSKHISSLLSGQQNVYYLNDKFTFFDTNEIDSIQAISDELTSPYKSHDQCSAVETIVKALSEKTEYCCVLTSGRGRGKSSALGFITDGFITNQLLNKKSCKLLICAPKLSVANPLFFHLHKQCPQGVFKRSEFTYKQSVVKFIAPDLLLENKPAADVLLIDEAAAIPISILQKLLKHYSKIILSTTTHGYEGTGRGFVLKFFNLLDSKKPGWQKIELHQPIRWAINDPLETWIESLLFLNVKSPLLPEMPSLVSQCNVVLLDRKNLLNKKQKMDSIFALLVAAHYRTSPSDFQYLLDSENIRIYSLEFQYKSLAVLVVNQEGGFDSELSSAIYRGERRPQGNLLAQTLCFHGGCETAAELKYARIMRIAVHPEVQQLGLGSYLLNKVIEGELKLGMDVIGSSFSVTSPLLDFWNKAGLKLVRIGFSRDHVTASNSAVMVKSLSTAGNKIVKELDLRFKQNILLWKLGPLSELSDEIADHRLLQSINCLFDYDLLCSLDLKDVASFANHNRNYDACMPAITRFIKSRRAEKNDLSENERLILNLSAQYMNDWKSIVLHSNNQGKAQAISQLRLALSHLLSINK